MLRVRIVILVFALVLAALPALAENRGAPAVDRANWRAGLGYAFAHQEGTIEQISFFPFFVVEAPERENHGIVIDVGGTLPLSHRFGVRGHLTGSVVDATIESDLFSSDSQEWIGVVTTGFELFARERSQGNVSAGFEYTHSGQFNDSTDDDLHVFSARGDLDQYLDFEGIGAVDLNFGFRYFATYFRNLSDAPLDEYLLSVGPGFYPCDSVRVGAAYAARFDELPSADQEEQLGRFEILWIPQPLGEGRFALDLSFEGGERESEFLGRTLRQDVYRAAVQFTLLSHPVESTVQLIRERL